MRKALPLLALATVFTPAAAQPLDPDVQAYLQRTGGEPSREFVSAADHFVRQGKAAGWWPKLSAMYFFCAPSCDAALHNVKDVRFDLAAEGKLDFTSYAGLAGDGTTGYLETGVPLEKFPGFKPNAHSLFIYSQTDHPSLASDLGAAGGGANLGVRARNAVQASIWSGTRVPVSWKVDSGVGLTGFVRTGSGGGFAVKDETQTDFLQKTDRLPSGTLRVFRGGDGKLLSTNRLAFVFIGSGDITRKQTADLSRACAAMLRDLGTFATPPAVQAAVPPHAFARERLKDVTPHGLEIFRVSLPPPSDSTDFTKEFPSGPVNNVIGRPWGLGATSSDTQIHRWEIIWSDRALGPAKGVETAWAKKANDTMGIINDSHGFQCRTEFTTYEQAIGSTLVKTAYSAGLKFRNDPDHPDHKGWGDIAEEWGYDVSKWQTAWERNPNDPLFTKDLSVDTGDIVHRAFAADPANVDAFFSHDSVNGIHRTSRDRVLLGQGRLADIPMAGGFLIDHEHADSRPPELELRFITEMAKIARAKKFPLAATGHAVDSGTGREGGWRRENAAQILALLDWYSLIEPSDTPPEGVTAHLRHQLDFFRGPKGNFPVPADKLCLQIQIGGPGQEISIADVEKARKFLIDQHIPRVFLANVYATPGGPLSRQPNQVTAALLGLRRN